ncbi:MAG: MBL fold metallo-hydrolase [Nanoarchaeota archaeon]|nr:MBL fold metallo-hydrolase [Nanoarchaeota archaeon]MBU1269705.1 MBL fold metallo-hydrolase [Nanoarchaeota archaeon]MBU1604006.1 MBL fold metallo-hydrolase [Nanoarchaeota archaeon]MBU2442523.1 MBL fold metallo-hydrolase [Nanoarchaeota archaeon]
MNYEGIVITKLAHDGFKIKADKVVYIDPFKLESESEKADLVLITHEHYDHCSIDDVKKVSNQNTIIITVADCQSKLSGLDVKNITLVEPGNKVRLLGLEIEVVPAYNVDKFRSPGIPFHSKENNWVGFIITVNDKRIYHAGDTDKIPEMSDLKDIDVALLPVSGTYVMTATEAAQACKLINPKLAIPMHYGSIVGTTTDAETFKRLAPCRVEIL